LLLNALKVLQGVFLDHINHSKPTDRKHLVLLFFQSQAIDDFFETRCE
jgi:hypothetical protein